MAIPNDIDFTAFDTLTAAQMDDLIENDKALADGSAINDGAIAPLKLGRTVAAGNGTNITATGNNVITGLGFRPRVIQIFAGLSANGSNASSSIGVYDRIGATTGVIRSAATTGAFYTSSTTSFVIDVQVPNSTIQAQGTISATSSDGFTLNISTANGTAVAWRWIAWA